MAVELIWTADTEGRLLCANGALLRWLGSDFRGVAFHQWVDRIHPEDIDGAVRLAIWTFPRGAELLGSCRLLHADGSWRWVMVLGRPWKGFLYRGLIEEW